MTFTEAVVALIGSGTLLLGGHHALEARRAAKHGTNGNGTDAKISALHRRLDELRDKMVKVQTLQETLHDAHLGPNAIDPLTGQARWHCQTRSLTPHLERLAHALDDLPKQMAKLVEEARRRP